MSVKADYQNPDEDLNQNLRLHGHNTEIAQPSNPQTIQVFILTPQISIPCNENLNP